MVVSIKDSDLRRIIHIMKERGEYLSPYREGFLRRRIANRLRKNRMRDTEDYIRLLRTSPAEVKALKEELSINVTEFFRDPPVWASILPLMKELLEKKRAVHIWSAGTASGEETYSLAIAAVKALKRSKEGLNPASLRRFGVLGTDISQNDLTEAKNGTYPEIRIRNISVSDRRYFFIEKEPGWYQIRDEIKKRVIFRRDDLSRTNVTRKMDLILCRNVMIYLSREMIEGIWENIRNLTSSGSFVVVGRAESMIPQEREYFDVIDPVNRIYRRN